jgi:AraC-like DNA-binding protein
MMKTLPLHFDLFALIILLGVAQGLFLGILLLTGTRGQEVSNRCLGGLALALAAILGEIWLEYTNYMFRTLAIIDFAEPFNFALGPLFFLFVFARINGRLPRRWVWHFLPFGFWLLYGITWFFQPIEFKYNSYISAWHPQFPFIPTEFYLPGDALDVREYIIEFTLLSSLIYLSWATWLVFRAYRERRTPFWGEAGEQSLRLLRDMSLLNMVFPVLILLVRTQFEEDLGDHLLATYITLTIYTTCFFVLRDSDFFRHKPVLAGTTEVVSEPLEVKRKYERSALSPDQEEAILGKLNHLTQTEKLYLNSDLSLSKLAERLGTSSHYVSQMLNDRLGQTFFDWLAQHRIAEAQQLLNDPATAHLKIEEIAERVGYNAPSAFHTAFKRITGQTPASFRSARSS